MLRIVYILLGGLLFLASLALKQAEAASVHGQARDGYGRLNFQFEAQTHLQSSIHDTTATLTFDAPLDQPISSVRSALPSYVTDATLSADKKTLTLSLSKPYRIRQFTSGTRVGIDFIGEGEVSPKPQALSTKKAEAQDILSTKKPAASKPKDKPATVAKAEPKKTPAPTAVMKPAPKRQEVAAATDILTTKEAPPATTPQTGTVDALTTKEPNTSTAVQPAAVAPPSSSTPPPAAPAIEPAGEKPFIVTANTLGGETLLHFPWTSRTAVATYKRGRTLWVIFSHYKDAHAAMLQTIVPPSVTRVTQYADSERTILRLATDGTLNAKAVSIKGSHGWDIVLTTAPVKPRLDISISMDGLAGNMRAIFGAYDVASPLRFYDPDIGDLLYVVPAYEEGRAITQARSYPEFSALPTTQGIAIAARRDDVSLNATRGGLVLTATNGLALSEDLPLLSNSSAPASGISAQSSVMMPYDQWYVPPNHFKDTLLERLSAVTTATKATKADRLMDLVKLYLAYGYGPEAGGALEQIRAEFPQYYVNNKLAMLRGVTHVLMRHMDLAAQELNAPELVGHEESSLWRQLVALYAPPISTTESVSQQTVTSDSVANSQYLAPQSAADKAAAAAAITASTQGFQFLKFSRPFIRFYPPRIRQQLAVIAADAYLEDLQEEKALAVYDTLLRDKIIPPLNEEAEYAQAMVAQRKEETEQALELLDRLSKQPNNLRIQARARHAQAKLRYLKGLMSAEDAVEAIESARMVWRGDAIERKMLQDLIQIYTEAKRYDEVLRTKKAVLDNFPNDPETLALASNMGELFQRIFLEGLADEMTPLQALALFYEFRELTPLGENGDKIIQNLSDRLAAMDLLDRATQLLEHQVQFRSTGEARSRIGARLALLHLLNKHPQEALKVLEVTNFGENNKELQIRRRQLTAEALTKLDKHEEALGVLFSDTTPEGKLLRLDILWAMKDWPNVVNHAEDILNARPNLTEPLTIKETEVLLKLALAYNFEGDYTQLRFLRDYYSGLIPDTAYQKIFDFITNDTNPLDPEDYSSLAEQISRTEGFMGLFKEKIAAGKLSEAVK